MVFDRNMKPTRAQYFFARSWPLQVVFWLLLIVAPLCSAFVVAGLLARDQPLLDIWNLLRLAFFVIVALLFAFLLVNGWQIEEITTEYAIDGPEAERLLIRLHRAKIVELLPLNRFKLLTARNFTWRRNGPVQKFFEEEVQREFLAADFTTDIARFRFVAGRLSRAAIAQMQNAIERIGQEFDQLVERDFALPRAERPVCGAVFAIRPWEFSQFARFKRGNDKAAAKTILQP
jgi:hypothetical protein